MADPREKQFQQDIVDALTANGWQVGSSNRYDAEHALYPDMQPKSGPVCSDHF